MDLLPYGFLIGIVLMSGAIAVLADDVGRRLGKKRLHIRGLRPKRVAQLGTFMAGIIVSLLTIVIVSMVSSGVRQWISEGNRAIARAKEAEANLNTANRELARAQQGVKLLKRTNDQLTGATARAQAELATTQREEHELAQRMAGIRTRLATLRRSYDSANRRIGDLNGEVRVRRAALTVVQQRLSTIDGQLAGVNRKLAAARILEKQATKAAGVANTAAEVANEEKRQTDIDNQRLLEEKQRLTEQKASLEQANSAASAKLASASKDLEAANKDLGQAKGALADTQKELEQAQGQRDFVAQIGFLPRHAPPIYLQGDEVARLAIPAELSMSRATEEVTSLLRKARVEARIKGAVAHGRYLEAAIVEHTDPATGGVKTPDELAREVAERIAGAAQPMALIASSSVNAFKGEPVSIEIEALPNPVVFSRNTLVAKADVDGRLETDVIIQQLGTLVERVRERAKKDNMIPRLGTPEMYGAVSSDQFLRLVNEVKSSNRAVEVRAFADSDTRAGDSLRLRFSVR